MAADFVTDTAVFLGAVSEAAQTQSARKLAEEMHASVVGDLRPAVNLAAPALTDAVAVAQAASALSAWEQGMDDAISGACTVPEQAEGASAVEHLVRILRATADRLRGMGTEPSALLALSIDGRLLENSDIVVQGFCAHSGTARKVLSEHAVGIANGFLASKGVSTRLSADQASTAGLQSPLTQTLESAVAAVGVQLQRLAGQFVQLAASSRKECEALHEQVKVAAANVAVFANKWRDLEKEVADAARAANDFAARVEDAIKEGLGAATQGVEGAAHTGYTAVREGVSDVVSKVENAMSSLSAPVISIALKPLRELSSGLSQYVFLLVYSVLALYVLLLGAFCQYLPEKSLTRFLVVRHGGAALAAAGATVVLIAVRITMFLYNQHYRLPYVVASLLVDAAFLTFCITANVWFGVLLAPAVLCDMLFTGVAAGYRSKYRKQVRLWHASIVQTGPAGAELRQLLVNAVGFSPSISAADLTQLAIASVLSPKNHNVAPDSLPEISKTLVLSELPHSTQYKDEADLALQIALEQVAVRKASPAAVVVTPQTAGILWREQRRV